MATDMFGRLIQDVMLPGEVLPGSTPSMLTPDAAVSYAETMVDQTIQYTQDIADALDGMANIEIVPTFPTVSPNNIQMPGTAPAMTAIDWQAPTPPATFVGDINVSDLIPEPFDEDPPVMMFGSAPVEVTDLAPDAPGVNLVFEDPTLSLTLPTAPSLFQLQIHSFDGVTMPTLTEDIPELTAVAPTATVYTPGDLYSSALLTATQDSLYDRIVNGGTGLPAAVENAIWDREREREHLAAQDALDALERMETLGYAFPPGVYLDAQLKVRTELGARTVTLGRDIMIKQAELELENTKLALAAAVQLEGQLIQYNNQVEQRLFETAKYTTDAAIAIYNARVQAYATYVDAYKTKVIIYEAQVKGQLAAVEVYKAELAAEQAKAEINTAMVQSYKVQVDAAMASVEVYKAQIQAILAKASIEKLKVDIYGEQVRAYTGKIAAYTANVEGFKALIGAEVAKQDAYKTKIQAYSAEVEAATKVVGARIEEYKGKIMAKTAEWDGYKATAIAEASRAQAITASNQTAVEGYKAEVAVVEGYNSVLTKQWQATLEQSRGIADIGVTAAKANADIGTARYSLAVEAAKASAQVSAQVAAAAINAVNFNYSNSMGYSYSIGNSSSVSAAQSVSNSSSVSNTTSDIDQRITQISL